MVVNLKDVWNLSKGFPKVGLVKVACVVMEIGMIDVLIVFCGPWCIFPVVFPTHCEPLLQERNLFPKAISIDLISKAELAMESTTLYVFLHHVFPHEAYSSEIGPILCIGIHGKVVARMCNKAPIGLMSTGNKEFISSTAEVRSYGVGPFGAEMFFHLQINIVSIKAPSLMSIDGICL
jgi:hypothetical protein